jgi:beta-xylosidase
MGLCPPLHPADFPDPFVLRTGARYVAYATQAGPVNVQAMVSEDLRRWHHLGDVLPRLGAWAVTGLTWSPAVLERDGRYVLYYVAREPRSGRQAISVATADRPEGPFHDARAAPLVFQGPRGGSIDPSPFLDADSSAYLLWKSDENAVGRPSGLWCQRLAADGLDLVGPAAEILRHDRAWEVPLVEAPSMVAEGGRYHLFYSGGSWESAHYAIGYAVGASPLGPFRKATRRRPWLAADDEAAGPGGQEFFTDAAGTRWMAYHAWTPGRIGYRAGGARSLRLARLVFYDGRPVALPPGP